MVDRGGKQDVRRFSLRVSYNGGQRISGTILKFNNLVPQTRVWIFKIDIQVRSSFCDR